MECKIERKVVEHFGWYLVCILLFFSPLVTFGSVYEYVIYDDYFRYCHLNVSHLDSYYQYDSPQGTQVYVYPRDNQLANNIIIPSTVTGIEEEVEQDEDLVWVTLSRRQRTFNVIGIAMNAFAGRTSLTSVTIGNGVTSIGASAFSRCSGLTSITIPNSVTSIGESAFSYCSGLTELYVAQYVAMRGIGNDVFSSCAATLRRIAFDMTVSNIHENAFQECKSLTTVEVASGNEHYFVSPTDGCLYDRDQTTLLCCPRDKTSIVIPYGVKTIANYAFAYCSNLVSVAMPVTLKTIGECAFFDCASLPTVTIPDGVVSIGNYAFGDCRKLRGVTIPSGVQALSTSAFNNCDILWTEWYRTLADFAVNGRAYDLTQTAGDRSIADVTVDSDCALDSFVLKEGKVYDSVLYIRNNANSAVKVTLPSGHTYQAFKGATPLTLPPNSQSILTITRVAGGNAGGNVFLVTREELETVQ